MAENNLVCSGITGTLQETTLNLNYKISATHNESISSLNQENVLHFPPIKILLRKYLSKTYMAKIIFTQR